MRVWVKKKKMVANRMNEIYSLTTIELRTVLLLANGKLNSYNDFREFVYHNRIICNDAIKNKVMEIKKKYHLPIKIYKYGIKMEGIVYIE